MKTLCQAIKRDPWFVPWLLALPALMVAAFALALVSGAIDCVIAWRKDRVRV